MEFGTTYIILFGFKIFEPSVILTNLLIFLVSLFYYLKLRSINNTYLKQTAQFVLLMGFGTIFAAVGHGVQIQMGEIFFRIILFISNALNLFAFYFCFKAAYTYSLHNRGANKYISYTMLGLTFLILIFASLTGSFLFIKIPAGVVLIYSLIVHYIGYRNNEKGSGTFVVGILIGFLSIIVHSLRISLCEWFNHKDIAHVIIAVSLIIMCTGARLTSENLNSGKLAN